MAVRRQTLRLLRQLRVTVGNQADQAVRDLTDAWMRAWDELATGWRQAILDVVARAVADGRWPPPWQLARMDRLAQAVVAATQALEALSQQAGVTVTNGAATIVAATAAAEPMVYA